MNDKPSSEDDKGVVREPSPVANEISDLYKNKVAFGDAAAAPASPAGNPTAAEGTKKDGEVKEDMDQRSGEVRERMMSRRRRSSTGVNVKPAAGTNNDVNIMKDMGQRTGVAQERRMSRRRNSSERMNVRQHCTSSARACGTGRTSIRSHHQHNTHTLSRRSFRFRKKRRIEKDQRGHETAQRNEQKQNILPMQYPWRIFRGVWNSPASRSLKPLS